MKKNLFLLTIFVLIIACQNTDAQTKLIGKTYIAEIGATCKDGIGMIYKYRILKFDKNTVTSSYKVVASVAPERRKGYESMYDDLTKTYQWKTEKDILLIENCKEFSKMKIQKSRIIGYDNDWKQAIEFVEQTK